jgi:hypothetical protein
MAWRPDTRQIVGVTMDSVTAFASLDIIRAAQPSEASLCYTGALTDTSFANQKARVLWLTGVEAGKPDSANERAVWYSNSRAGCGPQAIAIGHSHPYYPNIPCDHSDKDAYLLFGDPHVLVSVVWCADGQLNYLWQDGSRTAGRWHP